MDTKRLTPAQIVIIAAGAVALVGTFLDFFGINDLGANVWDGDFFPIATLMALFVVVMALQIVLAVVLNVQMSATVAGFTWLQVHLVLGFFAALYAVAWLIVDSGSLDRKIGFWFVFVACIGGLVGAILLQREAKDGTPGAS